MIADIARIHSFLVAFRIIQTTMEVVTDDRSAPIITPSSIGDDLETMEIPVDRHSIKYPAAPIRVLLMVFIVAS